MCGIFAFHGTGPVQPSMLAAVAVAAGRRGPHGTGCYARDHTGTWQGDRRLGPVDRHLPWVTALAGATVLGHTRLATASNHRQVDALQPTITPGGDAVAHNGVIRNPLDLWPHPQPSDSAALALAYNALRDARVDPFAALEKLLTAADHVSWAVVVADRDGRLYAHRAHHPLYAHRSAEGVYLCSQPVSPDAEPLPEHVTTEVA